MLRTEMMILLLFVGILHVAGCSCPPGYDLFQNGVCTGFYSRMTIAYSQAANTAVDQCKQIQGYPVTIHSDEDQTYWVGHADKGTNLFLIGLLCNNNTKKWEWADGTALNYKPPTHTSVLDNNCALGNTWYMHADGNWQYSSSVAIASFDIFCKKQLQLPVPADDGCESFEDDSEDGACYQIGLSPTNWQEAQMICRSFGADLASVHNQRENSFIRRLAVSKGALGGLFLGATISGKGNEFGWIDGSEWNYENFFTGFPVPGLGDCLVMDTEGVNGQWVNVDYSANLSVACMRNHSYSSPACSSGPYKEGQIISSPGFPYNASTPCEYILNVDAGKRLELQLHLLEANSCCDRLVIVDNYFGGTVIANVSGYLTDQFYTSTTNFMRVSWLPNGGVNVRGFMMTFRGV